MENTSEPNIFIINSDLKNLSEIRDFIYNYTLSKIPDNDFALRISLAVDEVCSNLTKYSYKLYSKNFIKIKIDIVGNKLQIDIMDNGEEFNIVDYKSPSLKEYYSNYMKSGLGITIIKLIVDEISYNSYENYNSLTLIKYYTK